MSPHTFKVLLTIYFGIGVVTSIIGQGINLLFFIKRPESVKVTFNFTWILNSVIIYGLWRWL